MCLVDTGQQASLLVDFGNDRYMMVFLRWTSRFVHALFSGVLHHVCSSASKLLFPMFANAENHHNHDHSFNSAKILPLVKL